MNNDIAIVDYGIGNLLSVFRGIQKCGYNPLLISSKSDIQNSRKLILPGVGAFNDGMSLLEKKDFIYSILRFAASGKPLLGICLGMQMLFDKSLEHGMTKGLSLIPGDVIKIPETTKDGKRHKIPHISWSELIKPNQSCVWDNTILENTKIGSNVYFIHSYYAKPANSKYLLAETEYNGRLLAGVVKKNNIYGCQFHPEKSGSVGLNILKKFCELNVE